MDSGSIGVSKRMKKFIIIAMLWSLPVSAQEIREQLVEAKQDGSQTVAQNWAKHCAKCHDIEGKSTNVGSYVGAPYDIYEATKGKELEDILKLLNEGKNKMPSFKKKMTEQELFAIASYIDYTNLVNRVMKRRARLEKELKRIKEEYKYLPECEVVQ